MQRLIVVVVSPRVDPKVLILSRFAFTQVLIAINSGNCISFDEKRRSLLGLSRITAIGRVIAWLWVELTHVMPRLLELTLPRADGAWVHYIFTLRTVTNNSECSTVGV